MNCPRCDQDHSEDKIETPRTIRGVRVDYREHRCKTCGCKFTSEAKVQDVYVFNPVTMQDEAIPYETYVKVYHHADLGKVPHPAVLRQGGLLSCSMENVSQSGIIIPPDIEEKNYEDNNCCL